MENKYLELFGPLDELARTAAAEAPAAGTEAKLEDRLSALNLLTDRLPPDERAQLIKLARESHWVDNEPMLILQTFGQAKLDAMVAELDAAKMRLLEVLDEIVSAETGLTKYREQLQNLTEDTKAAIVEAAAYLNVLVKTKETGSTVLAGQLKAALAKAVWQTAACMVGADLLIRLILTAFH